MLSSRNLHFSINMDTSASAYPTRNISNYTTTDTMLLYILLLLVLSIFPAGLSASENTVPVFQQRDIPPRISSDHEHSQSHLTHSAINLPMSANQATDPSTYASHSISAVPGFFMIQPRVSGTEDDQLDLKFDQKNTVILDPSLYITDADFSGSLLGVQHNEDHLQQLAWENLKGKIMGMNKNAEKGTRYKVVFLARHGQGQHNAAEMFYGMEPWECYWAMAGGNETHQWGPDAKLTPYGIHEGEQRADAWKRQILLGAPIPQKHFVSPLSRSIKTMEMTWKNVYGWLDGASFPGAPRGVRPIVKELFRETMSLHYSDHRSSLQTIHTAFPYLLFSPQPFPQFSINSSAFPEDDPLWDYQRESMFLRDLRIKTALQDALTEAGDDEIFIGITSHFGTIESALRVLGHHAVDVGTAGIVPVVVKIVDDGGRGNSTGWYGTYRDLDKREVESRSACEGWPPVKIQGGYIVPGGMGTDLM